MTRIGGGVSGHQGVVQENQFTVGQFIEAARVISRLYRFIAPLGYKCH